MVGVGEQVEILCPFLFVCVHTHQRVLVTVAMTAVPAERATAERHGTRNRSKHRSARAFVSFALFFSFLFDFTGWARGPTQPISQFPPPPPPSLVVMSLKIDDTLSVKPLSLSSSPSSCSCLRASYSSFM